MFRIKTPTIMLFGLFKKKTEKEVLEVKYRRLLQQAYKLSTINRKASDEKTAEAEEIMKQIERLSGKQRDQ